MTQTLTADPAQSKRVQLASLLKRNASEKKSISPVSPGQKALWFLYQSARDSAAYNVGFSVRIYSEIDVGALRRALQSLADRHGALRSYFAMQEGQLVQVTRGYQEVAFDVAEIGSVDEAELSRQVAAAYRQPFDLENGPVFRAHLFLRSPVDSVLLIVVNHIVYDGWSLWLNLDELGQLYRAEAGGIKSVLPKLDASFQDFVRAQEAMLASPKGEQGWSFWKEQLSGDLPTLNLPTDFIRPPVQTFNGSSHPIVLPKELAERLKILAKNQGVTLFTALLTAFQVLLHRYSGQHDILVGTPTAGQRDAQFANVVGYFVNLIVIRGDLSANPTFEALLSQIQRTVLAGMEHQDYPFPLLVERLRPKRDPSHSPLFQVSFVFQRSQRSKGLLDLTVPAERETGRIQWGGLEVGYFELAQQEGQFDLELELVNIDDEVFGSFKYNTDLFKAASIARLADAFSTLLQAIAADPTQKIDQLPLLSPSVRAQMVKASEPFSPVSDKLECLHVTFESRAKEAPGAVALIDQGRRMTYGELNTRSDCLARFLQSLGVGPDVLVGISVERSWEMVVGIWGILKAGGAYLPIDPSTPIDRRSFIIEDSAVSVVLTQEKLLNDLNGVSAKMICLDSDWDSIAAETAVASKESSPATVEHLAYVIYTSGTTGRPKGVQITHRNVARLFTVTQPWYNFNASDVWTLFHSFAFDFSVWEIWGALLYGGKLVIVPYLVSRSPSDFRALVATEGVTVLNQTPSAFRAFMQADAAATAPHSLRYIIFGGEALDIQSLKPWFDRYGDATTKVINMYGITETTVHTTYRPLGIPDLAVVKSVIGVPLPDLQVYLLDPSLEPVPVGVTGEIYVGGEGVARGYLNRPELDAVRFIKNPFSEDSGSRLYKSGDLARYLENGDIEYLGRSDNQVKIRGFRIELGEIETVLGSHPDVAAAVVRVQKTEVSGDRLIAYIIPRVKKPGIGAALRAYLADKLPDYMVPSVFLTIESLPLTANGKIDYGALPLPENTRNDLTETLIPPRDGIERRLARLWERVLGLRAVGVRDNFFALGGHSLLAVYLMAEIKREFSAQLPLATLFRNPSIEKLGEVLRSGAEEATWSPLVPIRPSGDRPPLFCVAGGGGNVLYFYSLAQHLPEAYPFYGLQAIGLDGRREPLSSVEEIAAEYIREIRQVQPRGPYWLGGHCFGSWIAFEMAQQLRRDGEEIGAVIVIDSPAPYLKPEADDEAANDAAWLTKFGEILSESAGRDLGIDLRRLSCLGGEAQMNYFKERMEAGGLIPPGTPLSQVRGFFRVFIQNSKTSYLPKDPQPVPIALFRASEFHPDYDYSPTDDTAGANGASSLGWATYATEPPSVDRVPGNHITLMTEPHVTELAAKLAERITSGPSLR